MESKMNEQLLELVLEKLLKSEGPVDDSIWEIGKYYLIRTVSMIQVGTLKKITDKELLLSDAAWVAETGRFHDTLKNLEECKEVEPFPNPVIVGRGSIVDATTVPKVILQQK
jgi:hypothetical protein